MCSNKKIKDNFSQKDDGDAPSGSISAMLVDMVPEKINKFE